MKITDIQKGIWQVTRFCCTSGQCITCRASATHGIRKVVVQIDKIDEKSARTIAANWSSYDALAGKMPGMTIEASDEPDIQKAKDRMAAERKMKGLR